MHFKTLEYDVGILANTGEPIFSSDFVTHLEHLDVVLTRLQEVNMKVSTEKCVFAEKKLSNLSHTVGASSV